MGHTGEELGADCADLWEAGHYELKPLGARFRDAAAKLALTEDGEHNFWRDTNLGGPYGPVRSIWADFRDDVFDVLKETATNLELTGDALILAANQYLAADDVARQKFDELKPAVIAAQEADEQEPPK